MRVYVGVYVCRCVYIYIYIYVYIHMCYAQRGALVLHLQGCLEGDRLGAPDRVVLGGTIILLSIIIIITICTYIYIYICTYRWGVPCLYVTATLTVLATANFPYKILGFGGFGSSNLNLKGGIPRPTGKFPESLNQAILVGIILVARLGVHPTRITSFRIARFVQGLGGPGIPVSTGSGMCVYVYIYIYIERERCICVYIYIERER